MFRQANPPDPVRSRWKPNWTPTEINANQIRVSSLANGSGQDLIIHPGPKPPSQNEFSARVRRTTTSKSLHTQTHTGALRHTDTRRQTHRHTQTHRDTHRHAQPHTHNHTQKQPHTQTHAHGHQQRRVPIQSYTDECREPHRRT